MLWGLKNSERWHGRAKEVESMPQIDLTPEPEENLLQRNISASELPAGLISSLMSRGELVAIDDDNFRINPNIDPEDLVWIRDGLQLTKTEASLFDQSDKRRHLPVGWLLSQSWEAFNNKRRQLQKGLGRLALRPSVAIYEFYADPNRGKKRRWSTAGALGGLALVSAAYLELKGAGGANHSAGDTLAQSSPPTPSPKQPNYLQMFQHDVLPKNNALHHPGTADLLSQAKHHAAAHHHAHAAAHAHQASLHLRSGHNFWTDVDHSLRRLHPNWSQHHINTETWKITHAIARANHFNFNAAWRLQPGMYNAPPGMSIHMIHELLNAD